MHITLGTQHLDLELAGRNLVTVRRQPLAPPIADVGDAVRRAVEEPRDFPALRRALTPDDHVAIYVDERLPHLAALLVPLLEHLQAAHIAPEAITLICSPPSSGQPWAEELPEAFQEVRIEVHQPEDRRKLSYLATTRRGRRIYLNRTAVDADQLVLLTGRAFDPVLGVSGAETALFPTLSDEATLQEAGRKISLQAPGAELWPLRQEAVEVAWLLGAPFLVQVIEGADGEVLHVLGGPVETSAAGQRLLEARWRVEVERPADLVIATAGGDPYGLTWEDLARAFLSATRVVKPGGRIALLTDANPSLGRSADILRQHDDHTQALKALLKERPADLTAGFLWASAAQEAKLYLLSQMPADAVEELFATPLEEAGQVARLASGDQTLLFLPDAHRTLAVLRTK